MRLFLRRRVRCRARHRRGHPRSSSSHLRDGPPATPSRARRPGAGRPAPELWYSGTAQTHRRSEGTAVPASARRSADFTPAATRQPAGGGPDRRRRRPAPPAVLIQHAPATPPKGLRVLFFPVRHAAAARRQSRKSSYRSSSVPRRRRFCAAVGLLCFYRRTTVRREHPFDDCSDASRLGMAYLASSWFDVYAWWAWLWLRSGDGVGRSARHPRRVWT